MNHTVIKNVNISAPIARVWKVVTNPASIGKWMLEEEMSVVSDWNVGSPIKFRRILGTATIEDKGFVLKREPEKVFQYNIWSKITRLADKPENYAIITLSFEPKGNETLLTVTHSNLIMETGVQHANFYWNTALQVIKKLAEA